ncbi:hypothetical protein [Sphingobacterium siyangense]|uniref:hypothetical protein n=1 Tax=Sphingobacterium siyangense TaxID=459529 RepID=UPI002FDA4C69
MDNNTLNYAYIGGVISILLTVLIVFSKHYYKRQLIRNQNKDNPNIGDIEVWLDEQVDSKRLNFFAVMAEWSLQPLFIICLTNIPAGRLLSTIIICGIVLMMIAHEFILSDLYANKLWYQISLLAIWTIYYFLLR